ncbi:MAG: CheR family methyltransferase [Roseiarcus sp.]|jgi:chemotaxis methyl-accepting protein methylase
MTDQLQERHFAKLARLVEEHTGIRLPPAKRAMVEGRLRKRIRALGLARLDEYGHAIFEGGKLDDEFIHLVDCVTTNKTDFFREPDHFDFLRKRAMPFLASLRRGAASPFKFWSAAASIGAEAYTIAMVAAEALGLDGRRFTVLGTDISTEVIAQAQRAVYPSAMADPVPPPLRERYMMRAIDAERREIRIVPELRRTVRFRCLNLMDPTYRVERDFDVIFCRNILIYFAKATQDAVLRRLCNHLREGGYLILGHSESLAGAELGAMRQVAPTIFQRAA